MKLHPRGHIWNCIYEEQLELHLQSDMTEVTLQATFDNGQTNFSWKYRPISLLKSTVFYFRINTGRKRTQTNQDQTKQNVETIYIGIMR